MKVSSRNIQCVLIANRGEIAIRIVKTARNMGLRTIAVYSQIDEKALHVKMADGAMAIGPAPAAQSYLSIENIIEAAIASGADAIHPGYGFLSESAEFAKACAKANIVFIGPDIEAMEIMADKGRAKMRVQEIGVPCLAGFEGEEQGDATFIRAAKKIGYPLMVKAAAGGGGRGMRLVDIPANLTAALRQARAEAKAGFGDDKLILERAIVDARHIEFQIFGDRHGNIIHLGERDCSLQRRHQKVIEEAPSPAVDEALRKRMGDVAVKVAQSVSYVGAGTVEFLLDSEKNFYFLEMNTRLQVEHPVTEMVTGYDLVKWQISIAAGDTLPVRQQDVVLSGHAIEARFYAEKPAQNFQPSSGKITHFTMADMPNIRVDKGIENGDTVSVHYDAMLAKIICHKPTRESAINGLDLALERTVLLGIDHNKEFLRQLLREDAFVAGKASINLIGSRQSEGAYSSVEPDARIACMAAVLEFRRRQQQAWKKAISLSPVLANWSSSPLPGYAFKLKTGETVFALKIHTDCNTIYRVEQGEIEYQITVHEKQSGETHALIDGVLIHNISGTSQSRLIFLSAAGHEYSFEDCYRGNLADNLLQTDGKITAPMHGQLAEIHVKTGDKTQPNTVLATLEAMKMRHDILAGITGIVEEVHCQQGAQIGVGDLIFEINKLEPKNATSG